MSPYKPKNLVALGISWQHSWLRFAARLLGGPVLKQSDVYVWQRWERVQFWTGHVSDLSFDATKLSSKVKCKPELEEWDETEKRSTDSVPSSLSLSRSLSFYLQPALDERVPLRIFISTYACICTSVSWLYTQSGIEVSLKSDPWHFQKARCAKKRQSLCIVDFPFNT